MEVVALDRHVYDTKSFLKKDGAQCAGDSTVDLPPSQPANTRHDAQHGVDRRRDPMRRSSAVGRIVVIRFALAAGTNPNTTTCTRHRDPIGVDSKSYLPQIQPAHLI
jgi:hypothetical protein